MDPAGENYEVLPFANRLRLLAGQDSVAAFARKCGIGDSLMRSYLAGSDPGRANVEKIWKATGCSLRWLMSGEGPMYPETDELVASEAIPKGSALRYRRRKSDASTADGREVLEASDGREFVLLPRYDVRVSAGGGSIVHSEQIVDYYAFNKHWFDERVGIPPEQAVLLEVHGDSMEPHLHDGDLVLVDKSKTEFISDAFYVLLVGGALVIKRVSQRLDGKIEIRSSNEKYGSEVLSPEQAEQLVVVGRARRVLPKERRLP